MNAATRKKLFDALMEHVADQAHGDAMAVRLYTESTNMDLDKLAPVIDGLLREREAELLKPMSCGHPTALLELAPIEEQPAIRAETVETGIFVLNAKEAVYRCAGCRQQQEFVRKVTLHVGKIFTREGPFTPTPGDVEKELANIT